MTNSVFWVERTLKETLPWWHRLRTRLFHSKQQSLQLGENISATNGGLSGLARSFQARQVIHPMIKRQLSKLRLWKARIKQFDRMKIEGKELALEMYTRHDCLRMSRSTVPMTRLNLACIYLLLTDQSSLVIFRVNNDSYQIALWFCLVFWKSQSILSLLSLFQRHKASNNLLIPSNNLKCVPCSCRSLSFDFLKTFCWPWIWQSLPLRTSTPIGYFVMTINSLVTSHVHIRLSICNTEHDLLAHKKPITWSPMDRASVLDRVRRCSYNSQTAIVCLLYSGTELTRNFTWC